MVGLMWTQATVYTIKGDYENIKRESARLWALRSPWPGERDDKKKKNTTPNHKNSYFPLNIQRPTGWRGSLTRMLNQFNYNAIKMYYTDLVSTQVKHNGFVF